MPVQGTDCYPNFSKYLSTYSSTNAMISSQEDLSRCEKNGWNGGVRNEKVALWWWRGSGGVAYLALCTVLRSIA